MAFEVTVEISRVDSANTFAIILSFCFLVVTLCITEGRAGARAFGSSRFATSLLSSLSHDSHLFRAASSFAVTPVTLGVQKRVALIKAWTLGIVSKVVKLALIDVFRTFRKTDSSSITFEYPTRHRHHSSTTHTYTLHHINSS